MFSIQRYFLSCLGLFTILFLLCEPVWAGPGGKIARVVAQSFWAKLILALLVLLFLPLVLWIMYKEKRAEKRVRQDLRLMASHDPAFDWLNLQQRAKDCFSRVHRAWSTAELSTVSDWMTSWYWQNQQQVALNKWESQGLTNKCDVKKINRLRPLLFLHRNDGGKPHEGSKVVIAIDAHMQDYLVDRQGELWEGDMEYKDVETLWTFNLEQGVWKVADIEESHTATAYAAMLAELPPIESTILPRGAVD